LLVCKLLVTGIYTHDHYNFVKQVEDYPVSEQGMYLFAHTRENMNRD